MMLLRRWKKGRGCATGVRTFTVAQTCSTGSSQAVRGRVECLSKSKRTVSFH